MTRPSELVRCVVCGRERSANNVVAAGLVRHSIADALRARAGDTWMPDARVCRACLNEARTTFLVNQLEIERGELSAIEAEVSRKAAEHTAIAADIEREFRRELTFGQRVADVVAAVGGSWPFVVTCLVFLAAWVTWNTYLFHAEAFDPYPYILLNLVLSCIAALQAPIIMMSQNRASARDRRQADEDYRVNLKAELEVAGLHEKIDHLLHVQWERMVEIQQTQLDLLAEIAGRRSR